MLLDFCEPVEEVAIAKALDFVAEDPGALVDQTVDNFGEGMEYMDDLVQHHMGLYQQLHMDHHKDLLPHDCCVTAVHSLGRALHTAHLIQRLMN